MASKAYKSLIVQLGLDGSGVQNGLSEINRNINNTQRELKLLQSSLKLEFDSEKFRRAQELAQRQLQQTTERVNRLRQGIEEADRQGVDRTTNAFRELERELLAAENAASRAQAQMEEINNIRVDAVRTRIENVRTAIESTGEAFESAGKKMIPVTTAIAAGLGYSAKEAVEFEKAMAKVSTIIDPNAKSLAVINDEILSLSDRLGVAAKDIAGAVYEAISSGVATEKAVEVVEKAGKAAVGGFTDILTAIDAGTSVINAYGRNINDLSTIFDEFLIAQDLGKTTFGEIAQSIGDVVPIAAQLNVNSKELLAAYAALTIQGIQTAEATTGLKSAFSNILDPSKEASDLAEKLGLNFDAAALQAKGLSAFLEEVKEKTGGNVELLGDLFGNIRALNSILVLTGNGAEDFKNALDAMENSLGAVDQNFEKMADTSAYKMEKALNDLRNSAIMLGQSILPIISQVSTSISDLAGWFQNLSEEQQKSIFKWALLAAAIGPVLLALGGITKAAAAAVGAYQMLATAVTAYSTAAAGGATATAAFNAALATNPAGLVALGVTSLVVALGTFAVASSNATSETDRLIKSSESLTKQIDNYKTVVDDATNAEMANAAAAEKLVDELYELAEKTDKTETEKRKLYSITEQLNSLIPDLSLQIDNETGALNRQRGEVVALIEEYKRLALVKAAEKDIMELGEQLYSSQKIQLELEEQKKAEESKLKNNKKHGVYEAFGIITTEDVILTDIARIDNQIQKQIDNQRKIEEKIKLVTDFINKTQSVADYRPSGPSTYVSPPQAAPPETVTVTSGTSSKLSKVDRARQEAIQKELDDLKFAKNMDLITEQEYYAKLAEFRDKYFEEGSKEWQQYTVEIYNYNKRLAEEQIKKEKEIAEENKRLVDDYIKRYKQYIEDRNYYSDWGTDNEVDALNRAKANLRKFVDEGKLSWEDYYTHVNDIEKRLYKLAKESYERQLQILKEFQSKREETISSTLKREQESIKAATQYKIEQIEKEYEKQKKLLETKIEGIDLEIKKRRELREDEAQDDRINKIKREIEVLQAKLQFERDAENIIQLNREIARKQQELANAEQEKADTLFYRQKELEKEAIRNEIEALWEEAERKKEQAKIEEQSLLRKAELRATKQLNEVNRDFVLSTAALQNQYSTNNNSNVTYSYDQRTNTVVVNNGTLTSAALANFLNKK